jgi:hypothetical protein
MGFHIINLENGRLRYKYVETRLEFANVPFITRNSIVYQGDKRLTPTMVGSNEDYRNFAHDWYRVGLKGQMVFKKQAYDNGLIIEELNQDTENFKQYISANGNNTPLKRGDFLIRNFSNIEVDIKCRIFYTDSNDKRIFDFLCEDVEKHKNMQEITKIPVLIAVYERKKHSEQVIENQIYFFSIDDLLKHKEALFIQKRNFGDCFHIPLDFTHSGFDYVKEFHNVYFGK